MKVKVINKYIVAFLEKSYIISYIFSYRKKSNIKLNQNEKITYHSHLQFLTTIANQININKVKVKFNYTSSSNIASSSSSSL